MKIRERIKEDTNQWLKAFLVCTVGGKGVSHQGNSTEWGSWFNFEFLVSVGSFLSNFYRQYLPFIKGRETGVNSSTLSCTINNSPLKSAVAATCTDAATSTAAAAEAVEAGWNWKCWCRYGHRKLIPKRFFNCSVVIECNPQIGNESIIGGKRQKWESHKSFQKRYER